MGAPIKPKPQEWQSTLRPSAFVRMVFSLTHPEMISAVKTIKIRIPAPFLAPV